MNDNRKFNLKASADIGKSVITQNNPTKVYKNKPEGKSYNIEILKSKKEINYNPKDIKKNEKGLIKIQETQTRDRSKKAKKIVGHNNKEVHQKEKNININNNKTNIKALDNNNNNNNNDIIVENLLKTKMISINPNIKNINKNFLKHSINEFELFDFNNNIKDNNLLRSELQPKTKKPYKINNNIVKKEKEVINNNNNFNENKKDILKKSDKLLEKEEQKNNRMNNPDKIKITKDKEQSKEIIFNNKIIIPNLLVPLTNFTKENNCFLNVLIQTLYHLEEFRESLLSKIYKKAQNEVVKELCELINSYKIIQEKYKFSNEPLEPTLSVNNLRTQLNNTYGNYMKGECGDPMETLEHLFDLIHKEYLSIFQKGINNSNCKCPSHNYFYLNLSELKFCKTCHQYESREYNEDCYMFNILAPEIINKINGKYMDFNSYKLCLFSKIKEQNEILENGKKTKFEKCKCEKEKFNYIKKIRANNSDNSYMIINITWPEEFPDMRDILTIFCLIPLIDKNKHIFSVKDSNVKSFCIKSIILYGIYHYVCIIYINSQKKWGIIDDKTIKYIDKYFDLIEYLLKNHLMPVGLVYSQNKQDIIYENEIRSNAISDEEYKKLYKFVEEVENWKKTKKPSITLSKGSFNETNQNYLDNNLFYKSILDLFNSSCDSESEETNKKIENKKDTNKTSLNRINNNNEDNKKKEILGRKFMGDFSENNLKGGLIILSGEDDEEDKNFDFKDIKDYEIKKEEKDVYIGKSYSRYDK